jgi:hypothetical protein
MTSRSGKAELLGAECLKHACVTQCTSAVAAGRQRAHDLDRDAGAQQVVSGASPPPGRRTIVRAVNGARSREVLHRVVQPVLKCSAGVVDPVFEFGRAWEAEPVEIWSSVEHVRAFAVALVERRLELHDVAGDVLGAEPEVLGAADRLVDAVHGESSKRQKAQQDPAAWFGVTIR